VPDPGDVLAEALLAPLGAEFYQQLRDRGVSQAQIRYGLTSLARRALALNEE
jgi:hypothetical protein